MTSVNNETYITSMNEIITKCKTPCEKRPMMGRSWYKQFGYNSPCSCAHEAHEVYVKKEEERKKNYLKSCIEKVENSYKTKIFIRPQLQEEIDLMYPITSGCWFMDWLNHRLYAEVMMITINLEVETPAYIDMEDLEHTDIDTDTDDDKN